MKLTQLAFYKVYARGLTLQDSGKIAEPILYV